MGTNTACIQWMNQTTNPRLYLGC